MKLPELNIGHIKIKYPIVLGAMGVGVTRSNLASAITNAGGLGVLSGVNLGFMEPDFLTNRLESNLRALRREIRKAKEMTNGGVIGVNFMVAMNAYAEHVKEAVKEGVDLIVSGAGLPTELPAFVKGSTTKLAPIVSSSKAAALIAKVWDRNHATTPDAIVVEGIKAGGHLGFKRDEIEANAFDEKACIDEIKKIMLPYEEKYNKKIPIILAGGIFDGLDIARALENGADAVQMATRFVATEECDAHETFKEAYVRASFEDVKIIVSPVGLPGRAIASPLLEQLDLGNKPPIKSCVKCLRTCEPKTTPYCISKALVEAVNGNWEKGLFFAGENVFKVQSISTVKAIVKELVDVSETALKAQETKC